MSKLLPVILVATALLFSYSERPNTAIAGTCASKCPPPPLGFVPGQRVDVVVMNRTGRTVYLVEKVAYTDAIPLAPGYMVRFRRSTATEPNFSMVFWDPMSFTITARISKPNEDTLRVVLVPGGNPGDRSLYIYDDGRVSVF